MCLSLELCFLPRRGAHLQKNEGLKLDCVEKSRKMKGRKIKKNKNQEIWSSKKFKGASRPAHVQIIYIFARNFAYPLCGPDAARRHSEAHSSRGWIGGKWVYGFCHRSTLLLKTRGMAPRSLWDMTLQAATHARGPVPACTSTGVAPAKRKEIPRNMRQHILPLYYS